MPRFTVTPSRFHRPRRLAIGAAVVATSGLLLMPAAEAKTGTGTILANPSAKLMPSASTSGKALITIPYKAKVTITCTTTGPAVTGKYGTTKLWDKVTYKNKTGFVTDAHIYTGTNGAVASACPAPPSAAPTGSLASRVDAFAKKWKGKYVDYDKVWGAQCVDLFLRYNADVVKAARASGNAKDIWNTYDRKKYTRVAASATPRKGDVAIWNGGWPAGGGYGHIAIVLSARGQSITTLSQNPGATRQWTVADHAYLSGFLRPKA